MQGYKKLVNNIKVLLIGNFLSKIFSVLLIPVYTSQLTTQEYGVADLISVTIDLLYPLITLTICESVLRFLLKNKKEKKEILLIGLVITFGACCIVSVLGIFITSILHIKVYYTLFFLYFVSVALKNLLTYFSKGIEEINTLMFGGVINTITFLASNILLIVIMRFGIRGYLASFIIANFVTCLFIVCRLKIWEILLPFSQPNSKLFIGMLKYSVPLMPNSMSWWISNSSDRYILNYFWGTAPGGLYATAYKIPTFVSMFSDIFISAWQISAVEKFGSKESIAFYQSVYRMYSSVLCICSAIVIIASKFLSFFLFQKDFFSAWKFVPLLAVAVIFSGMGTFVGSIFTSSMKTRFLFFSTITAALVNIILNFCLIPKFHGYGAAFATVVSYIVNWLMRLQMSKKIINMKLNYRNEFLAYFLVLLLAFVCIYERFFVGIIIFLIIVFVYRERFGEIFQMIQKMRYRNENFS